MQHQDTACYSTWTIITYRYNSDEDANQIKVFVSHQKLLLLWGCTLKARLTATERGCSFWTSFQASLQWLCLLKQTWRPQASTYQPTMIKCVPRLLSQRPSLLHFFSLFKSPVLTPGSYLLQRALFFWCVLINTSFSTRPRNTRAKPMGSERQQSAGSCLCLH